MSALEIIALLVIIIAGLGIIQIALAFLGLLFWPFRMFARWMFGKK